MSDILKRYIREILSEEIVTVSRGTESETYNVKFDKIGNIVQGKKLDIDDQTDELLQKATRLTSAPVGAILGKLSDPKIPVQQKARSPQQMVKILNSHWIDTLTWGVPSRIGRGELALTLAFKRSESVREPDFVSEDENVRLSVKFVGDGRATALTGGADQKVADTVQKLSSLLKIKFPQGGTWSATQMSQLLSEMDPKTRNALIPKIRSVLQEFKKVIVNEHSAMGIIMIDLNNGFYFVSDPSQIQPSAIRFGGTRIEFKGPYGGGATLENVLDQF